MEPQAPSAIPSDSELLKRIAQGDREAFGELYDRFSPVLYALSLKMLQEVREAEEVLQESMSQIWERAATYNEALGKALSWAVVITRQVAINRIRSSQAATRVVSEAVLPMDESVGAKAPLIEGEVQFRESALVVRRALHQLPADQRTPIELAFFGGVTQTEIALQLNQPLATIKARIRRGMMTLRDALEGTL